MGQVLDNQRVPVNLTICRSCRCPARERGDSVRRRDGSPDEIAAPGAPAALATKFTYAKCKS